MRKILFFTVILCASALVIAGANHEAQKRHASLWRGEASGQAKLQLDRAVGSDGVPRMNRHVVHPEVERRAPLDGRNESAEPYAEIKAELREIEAQLEILLRSGADASQLLNRHSELIALLLSYYEDTSRGLDQGGDNCDLATVVGAIPYCDPGSTIGFQNDVTPPVECAASSNAPDVMYVYDSFQDETVSISLCGSCFNTVLLVYDGCPLEDGTLVACNDNSSASCYPAFTSCVTGIEFLDGHTYYIVADGYGQEAGTYLLNITYGEDCVSDPCRGARRPVNDACTQAIAVVIPSETAGSSRNALVDHVPSCDNGYVNPPGVWYRIVGNGHTLIASTCNAATRFDTRLAIYCGGCDGLSCVAWNDDAPSCGLQSQVSWCSIPGVEYLIFVHGYNCATGNFRLAVFDEGPCGEAVPCCVTDLLLPAPGTIAGNTCEAFNACPLRPSKDRYVQVVIPSDGRWTFSLCGSSFDTYLFVGTECCQADVASNDNDYSCSPQSAAHCVALEAGTYWVTVEGAGENDCGNFTLSVQPCQPPPGEDCESPLVIASLPFSDNGNTCGYANDYDDLSSCSQGPWWGAADVAYRYVPPENQQVTFDLCASGYDVAVIIYENGVFLACNDDNEPVCGPQGNLFGAYIECLPLRAGQVYCIVVDGYHEACGDYTLRMTVCPPPINCTFASDSVDMGDLPFCNYPTLIGNPAHELSGVAWLGESVTPDVAPNVPDIDGADDGLDYLNQPWMPCTEQQVRVEISEGPNYARYVECSGHLYLNGWKDGNLDGDFCDVLCNGSAPEWIVRDFEVTPGIYILNVMDPGVFDQGRYDGIFRWRLTSRAVGPEGFGLMDPTGACPNMTCGTFARDILGEVEDYVIGDLQLFVELSGSFSAAAGDGRVTLTWSTASETENAGFEVLRENRVIEFVEGAGNRQSLRHYQWTEDHLDNGVTYAYTLRSVSLDGTRRVLGTASATPAVSRAIVTEYALYQNYPNPFNPITQIGFDLVEDQTVELTVYNPVGQEVGTLVDGFLHSGHHQVTFDAASLTAGLYFYRLRVGNVFEDTKKMLLVK